MLKGKIVAISIASQKGVKKENVQEALLKEEHGLVGDAHAGPWHRQVSLLALESIEKMHRKLPQLKPGDFAENITTLGLDLTSLPLGSKLKIGEVLLEVTQIGKKCHQKCNIFYSVGFCVMPKEGIFAKVLNGGTIKVGDCIEVLS
ncbi:MAG: hypothetical protein PWR24_1596 [Desulfonauticus sp.]|nr:hypothetical protein [Desulfonauticus sp.]